MNDLDGVRIEQDPRTTPFRLVKVVAKRISQVTSSRMSAACDWLLPGGFQRVLTTHGNSHLLVRSPNSREF